MLLTKGYIGSSLIPRLMNHGNEAKLATASAGLALFPGLPPQFLHNTSDQKLEAGTAKEQGYCWV